MLTRDEALVVPGVADAFTARIVEEAGFEALYVTGAGVANTLLGAPDIGLVTLTEMIARVGAIVAAVGVPVIADADTGFGGVANVRRTVRAYEDAGVAALHIEDQEFPKRCGHFEGKQVVPQREMLLRLAAALDARRDPQFMIFARTDARSIEGLDAAIARARAYLALGVDGIFVEAPVSVDELRAVGQAFGGVPLIANMVEGGKTPILAAAELKALGFSLVLYANTALRLGGFAVQQGMRELRSAGTSRGLTDRMLTWSDRQSLVRLAQSDAHERELIRRIGG
ncbi:MAG: isocitrate lyase/PEP mutase family protein [Candidatus Velthaea sp.]